MNAKLKSKWLTALRSGKYKQARGALGLTDGTLCCIGVGACVADKTFDALQSITGDAAHKLGLTQEQKNSLVHMNDYDEKSFKQIARWIEAHL